ncbi:MAG: ACT domain-containing protein [Desulfobacterales bacterium]|jgi:uncharacterized protein
MTQLELELLDEPFAIHRFSPWAKIPDEVFGEAFFNIVKTEEELSIVCRNSLTLNSERCDKTWSCIKVSGPLELDATGILAKLSKVLADAQISIFAISTYDTDYILVKADKAVEAVAALSAAGFQFI